MACVAQKTLFDYINTILKYAEDDGLKEYLTSNFIQILYDKLKNHPRLIDVHPMIRVDSLQFIKVAFSFLAMQELEDAIGKSNLRIIYNKLECPPDAGVFEHYI